MFLSHISQALLAHIQTGSPALLVVHSTIYNLPHGVGKGVQGGLAASHYTGGGTLLLRLAGTLYWGRDTAIKTGRDTILGKAGRYLDWQRSL